MLSTFNRKPALALQGAKDYQVTTIDFDIWKKVLHQAYSKFILYSALNPLFLKSRKRIKKIIIRPETLNTSLLKTFRNGLIVYNTTTSKFFLHLCMGSSIQFLKMKCFN